jgi:CPA2 family monovalent cation:H+ antiporter-2
MEGIGFIQDLAIVLLAAGVAGLLCRKIGLSVIVGYLIAGVVVGPYTPPFSLVSSTANINMLSQVGLVFLMFAIGLGLSLSRLAKMGLPTILATGLGAFFVVNLTRLLGIAAGWTYLQSAFVAGIFVVSSSAVIAKIVTELHLSHELFAQRATAVTVMEDIVAVVTMTVLASLTGENSGGAGIPGMLAVMGAFVVLLVGGGLFLVPRVFRRLGGDSADPELQTIVVAGILFALALSAAKAGYSLALGAFLLGAMVAEMPQKKSVEASFAGMRDLFSSVFFVSIGMMIDPRLLAGAWPWILLFTAFVMVARPLATGLALVLTGTPPAEARRAGLLLTPLGEFSFIIAQLGIGAKVLPEEYYPITVGTSVLTVLLTPLVNRHAQAILRAAARVEPRWISGSLDAVHNWMSQFRAGRSAPAALHLSVGRLGQAGAEMLLVTGILIFPPQTLPLLVETFQSEFPSAGMIATIFWSATGLATLSLLYAVWRNLSAISMILADGVKSAHFQSGVTAFVLRAVFFVILVYWMYLLLPLEALPPKAWLVIALLAAVLLYFFSRRFTYWHGVWRASVSEVLASGKAAEAVSSVSGTLGEWSLLMEEVALPAGALSAGKTVAELNLPSRLGVSILQLERNGLILPALKPATRLSPGDRLLLAGPRENLAGAARELTEGPEAAPGSANLRELVMGSFEVGTALAGKTLAELAIPAKTGVRIVGIQRGEERILTPGGDELLREGDRLHTVGTMEAQRAFGKMARG